MSGWMEALALAACAPVVVLPAVLAKLLWTGEAGFVFGHREWRRGRGWQEWRP